MICQSVSCHILFLVYSVQVAFAAELVSEHLENAAHALLAECTSPEGTKTASAKDKTHLRCLLLAIYGCMNGLRSCLPALDPVVPHGSASLSVVGKVCV